MDTLEIITLTKWLNELRRHGTYNRKWWPDPVEVRAILDYCHVMRPAYFIEVGTGNGVAASFVAADGNLVITFDPADRPKVYLDEKFPMSFVKGMIDFRNTEFNLTVRPNPRPCFWYIDVTGDKTVAKALSQVNALTLPGDVVYCKEFMFK